MGKFQLLKSYRITVELGICGQSKTYLYNKFNMPEYYERGLPIPTGGLPIELSSNSVV